MFAEEPDSPNQENCGTNASIMPAFEGDMEGADRATSDWWNNWMERRREQMKEVLGGLDPQRFIERPEYIRLRRLRSVLTKLGWLWMLSDEVDDDMLPGIVLLRGPANENSLLQEEAWQVYFGDNSFFVDSRYICELLRSEGDGSSLGKHWIRSLNVIVSVYGRSDEGSGSIKKSLEALLDCRSLKEVMIEVRSDREEESLVDEIIDEEIAEVATLLSEQLSGPVVVLRGCAWDRDGKVCTTKVVQGQWGRDKEAEGRLVRDFSARTEQDRQERAKREGEAGGWYYDSEDELQFDVERMVL